jgi:hypothetical protein
LKRADTYNMIELLRNALKTVLFIVVTMLGLVMAFVFALSTIFAIAILVVVARLRGKPFEVKEYWKTRQSRRKSMSATGPLSNKDVTDVEARDIR